MKRFAIAFLLLCSWQSHGQSDPGSLNRITPSASLVFLKNDGVCVSGRVKSANVDSIEVESYIPAGEKKVVNTLSRPDIVFVGESLSPHNVILSNRSSWRDVMEANPKGLQEEFRIKLKSGKEFSGKLRKVTNESIDLGQFLGHVELKKLDIATVDYVRAKPTSDTMQYLNIEAPWMLFFDPEFYYRATGLPGRLSIRLYDVSKTEDNTRLNCKPNHQPPPTHQN